ncbi:MAG: hypothetical protein GXY32_00270 [Ruminococcaceae bacterium]|nr:hypothetical protein [Oscillospiraceae bacterium]
MGNPVSVSYDGYIAIVTIDNPPMNALNVDVINGLYAAFGALEDNNDVRVVILTGAGDKAFVAGADIKEFPNWTRDNVRDISSRGQRLFTLIENFKTPVIGAINGFALGGGLELALVCDIRLASEKARMGLPEVSLGIVPGYGGTQRLAQSIPVGEAKKMIYSAEHVKADRAYQIGLVQGVYAPEALMDEAMALAKKIAANAPLGVQHAKRAVGYVRNLTIEQGMAAELEATYQTFITEDKVEGVDAFINKRTPDFKNR